MKYLLLAIILAMVATASWAEPPDFIPPGHQYGNGGQGGAGGNAAQQQGQAQGQAQGQLQGQAQGQLQGQGQFSINKNSIGTGFGNFSPKSSSNSAAAAASSSKSVSGAGAVSGAVSGGNSLTVNEAAIPADTTVEIKNVPNVYAPNIYPSAPCMGSSSVGGSGVGFGLSFGTSWVDEECQKMEASRNAPTPADKIFVWCQSKFASGSPSCGAAKTAVREDKARDGDDTKRTQTGGIQSPDGRSWEQRDGEWVEISSL